MSTQNRIDPHLLGLQQIQYLSGDEVLALCPFHTDHHASMTVNLETGLFFCFVCGAGGRATRLAVELGGRLTMVPRKMTREVDDGWRSLLTAPLAYDHPYLMGRGVTNQQVLNHRILNLPVGVGVPLHGRTGAVVGLLVRRTRSGASRYITYGDRPEVWPMQTAFDNHRDIVFVEGVFGALNAEHCGVPGCVAVLGATLQKEASWVANKPGTKVLFDDDEAGYLGAGRLLRLAPHAKILVPGAESDELSLLEWYVHLAGPFTTSMTDLAKLYGNTREFFKKLPDTSWGWKVKRRA